MDIEIRKERPEDYYETEAMTRRAFYNLYNPGCNEHFLVHKLRTHEDYLPECSRVALVDGKIAGTIMYFRSTIHINGERITVASFGPLCVDHKYKNMGIGGKLLRTTIPLVKEAGFRGIVIFGEPNYYPKFGFRRCKEFGLTDMEGNVSDPFMGLELFPDGLHIAGGRFEESPVCDQCSGEELEEFDHQFSPLKKIKRPCQWSYPNAYDDREGYHYEYATHVPTTFETLYRQLAPDGAVQLKDIWESVDKTPYVIFTGETPVGMLVISAENEPAIEHLYIVESKEDADRITKEVKERFYKENARP